MPKRAAEMKKAPAARTGTRTEARWAMPVRAVLVVWIALLGFWIRYYPVAPNDDSSTYAMNYAHAKGMVFGRDVAFTYGPLSYLIIPMHVGGNLGAGIAFQLALWVCYAAVIGWIVLARKIPLGRVLAFGVCLFLATGLFHEFGYAGPDMFVETIGLLLLAASLESPHPVRWFAAACVAALLVFFMKVSTALGLASALILYTAASFAAGVQQARKYLLCLAALPLAALAGYIALFGPPSSLWTYLRVAQEMSAGYGVTMSSGDDTKGLWTAVALMALWVGLTAVFFWRKARTWTLAVSCLGLLFFEFKHSFAREAGHIEIFFLFVALLCGWMVLFTRFPRRDVWYLAGTLAVVAGVWYSREAWRVPALRNPLRTIVGRNQFTPVFDYSQIAPTLDSMTATAMNSRRLPPDLLARIGQASMAGFPMECGYSAVNPVNMSLFPIFQWYMAYSPYLDGRNAAFLEDAGRAPRFLVFDWDIVDDRHPLLDSPASTIALARNYRFAGMYGRHMLLERRAAPRFGPWRLLESRTISLDQPVHAPAGNHPLMARIYLPWNTRGLAMKFLFRVPDVRLVASSAAGRGMDVRIPSDAMADGVPLNFLPFDMDAMRTIFSDEAMPDRVSTILIGGPGAQYLEQSALVEIYEAPDAALPFATPEAPDFAKLRDRGELTTARIESLNDTEAAAFSVVTVPNRRGFLRVQGWAAIEGAPAGAVFVDLDGKAFPAEYGTARPDVQALLHSPDALRTGFDWSVPAYDLGKAWHELGLKIVTKDRTAYYETARKLRFKME